MERKAEEMFRTMRRYRQELSPEVCRQILTRGTTGVLAVCGDDGYPYTIPLNYIYTEGKLYFHGAKTGHKIDAIRRSDKVSFCVIDYEQYLPEQFTTVFRSVVVFGRAVILEDPEEMYRAVDSLGARFSPQVSPEKREAEIRREWAPLAVIRLDIEHMTGKQAKELLQKEQ